MTGWQSTAQGLTFKRVPATGVYRAAASVDSEADPQGTNCRAVVSNRPGIHALPGSVYGDYADRGECENRNKELKRELGADRLSDHRYMANCFRTFLHCLAYR